MGKQQGLTSGCYYVGKKEVIPGLALDIGVELSPIFSSKADRKEGEVEETSSFGPACGQAGHPLEDKQLRGPLVPPHAVP